MTVLLRGLLAGVLAAAIAVGVRGTRVVEEIELDLVDMRTRAYVGTRPPDERIVLAQVFESDIAAVMQALAVPWPWSLEYNAVMFDLMHKAGVDVVVVDVLHLDRGQAADDFDGSEALGSVEAAMLGAEAAAAESYGERLRAIGRAIVAFQLTGWRGYEAAARVDAAVPRLLDGRLRGAPEGIARSAALLPVSRVARGAAALGFSNGPVDADGLVRRGATVGRWGERPVVSLSLATALHVTGGDATFEGGVLRIGDIEQPVMEDGSFLVNFRGPPAETYPRVAPSQLLEWALQLDEATMDGDAIAEERVLAEARARLEGKIVVWGYNAAGSGDVVASPISGSLAGPEYQATVLDNLLHGDGRVRAPEVLRLTIAILLALLGGMVAAGFGRPVAATIAVFLCGGLYAGFAFWALEAGTAHDLFTPLLGMLLAWGFGLVARPGSSA